MTDARPPFRVLIVEDQLIIALAAEQLLVEAGFVVCGKAANADAALRLALACRPDVITMDVRLGRGPDGIEAALRLRNAGVEAPVVFVTAEPNELTPRRTERIRKASLLPKPFLPGDLEAAIRRAVGMVAAPGK